MSLKPQQVQPWHTLDGVRRDADSDAYCIEFYDDDGRSVTVRITIQELSEFGQKPSDLQEVRNHTEGVLRAILEGYTAKHDLPLGCKITIWPADLGTDLVPLKRQFRQGSA